jgi:hypothetical protein
MEKSIWDHTMRVLLVTTWNNRLYQEYGHRFQSTYNWKYPYIVYNEDGGMYDLVPDLKKFVNRNARRPYENYLQDGVRFSYKVYAYTHAILTMENFDFIVGIDADSVFLKPLPEEEIKTSLYKEDCMLTYMGRGKQYSECGFLGFNMHHPDTLDFAREMKRMYDSDEIYSLLECHDSFVWDFVRLKFEVERNTKNNDIGDGGKGHIQARCVLSEYYDHTKGNRKKVGFSTENNRAKAAKLEGMRKK